jgi:hypothetical protein
VLSIAALGGNNSVKEMLLAQQQASDQWAFYQAKVIRLVLAVLGAVLTMNGFARFFTLPLLHDAVPAERRVQVVECHTLAAQILLDHAPVVDQERRRRLEHPPQPLRAERHLDDDVVEQKDDRRADEAAAERVVGPDDGVLHDVRDNQQDDEVEGYELSDLARARQPERQQQEEVDDGGSKDLLPDGHFGLDTEPQI